MYKRLVISSILLIAFAVLQAHNCIPHHHHDEETRNEHHNAHDEDGGDHSYPFNGQNHSSDFGKVVEQPPLVKFSFDNQAQILFDFTTWRIVISSSENPPVRYSFTRNCTLHLPFLTSAIPLRAPPAC
jgi:hypothetical protein